MTTPTGPQAQEAGLTDLLALSEAATPGEWCPFLQGSTGTVIDDAIHAEPGNFCKGGGDIVCNEPGEGYPESQKYWDSNSLFICTLVNWFRANAATLATPARVVSDEGSVCELVNALKALRIRYTALFDIYIRPTYTHDAAADSDLSLGLTDTDSAIARFQLSAQAPYEGWEFDDMSGNHHQVSGPLPGYAQTNIRRWNPKVTDEVVHGACNVFLETVADHQKGLEVDTVAMRAAITYALSTLQSGAEGKDGDSRDAARYRLLRAMFGFSEWSGEVKVHCDFDMPLGNTIDECRAILDAAIDTALQPGQGEG